MDLQKTKIALIKEILEIETPELIKKVTDFVRKEKVDFWDELTTEQQSEINKADAEIVNEETTEYETFMASHRNE